MTTDLPDSHFPLTDIQRHDARQALAAAFRAARGYRGAEAEERRLIDAASVFEACAREIGGSTGMTRDEAEAAFAAVIRRSQRPVTVQDLLSLAVSSFGKRLDAGIIPVETVQTGFCFLPTHGFGGITPGDGSNGFKPLRFAPRLRQLIALLNRNGIYTDDLLIYQGTVEPQMMRQQAYNLLQIPRLDREVLICDQIGEACFIGTGLRGPLFWATYRKDQLASQTGVSRLVASQDWLAQLYQQLTSDTAPGAKIAINGRNHAWPLSEDIILVAALNYAVSYAGHLPTAHTGQVEGLPGQEWTNWDTSLRKRQRGLNRNGVRGLGHLFQLYGLKNGRKENPDIIQKAIQSLNAGYGHGLNFRDESELTLTEDLILNAALRYAAVCGGRLPTRDTGPVDDMPGQLWLSWSSALSQRLRGLRREGVKGLGHLFRLYGLKNGQSENQAVIQKAISSLNAGTGHGLSIREETEPKLMLTENLILEAALLYAANHAGKLPTQKSGPVDGMPTQRWDNWQQALRDCRRGLRREGVKGLNHLFQLYGLKNGKKENPALIQKAIQSLNAGHGHGLNFRDESELTLTENLILNAALRFAAAHPVGRLPTADSGQVDGLPGQTWMSWNQALRYCMRGLRREGVKGLSHLFRLYGLKNGNKENPETVSRAVEHLQRFGTHGLICLADAPVRRDDLKHSEIKSYQL